MKKKIYFIGPIAALVVFAAYTAHFTKEYDAKQEAKATEARLLREARLKTEAEARKKAMDDALVAQQKLKKERLEKEAETARKVDARRQLTDTKNKNYQEQEKLARTTERLKKDVKNEQDAIAKLEASIKYNQAEKLFFIEYIAKSQENVKSLSDLLLKIDAAEAARATAAAAAAKQAKNNS